MPKEKFNLSIDSKLKKDLKHIALAQDTNCSELVELYIKALNANPNVLDALNQTIIATAKNKHKKKTR